MLRGIGTSKGIGMGKALLLKNSEIEVQLVCVEDVQAEVERFQAAKEVFITETEAMITKLGQNLGENERMALVLKNQIYLMNDQEINSGIESLIREKKICAQAAVQEICMLYIRMFSNMENEILNQRVADLEDMQGRLLRILSGVKEVDLTHLAPDTIIVADELHPSITAVMDTEHIVGIIAEKGGETSHASILARALEIPAVLSMKDACTRIKDGDYVIVDGEYGEAFVKPIPKTIEIYQKKREVYQEKIKELKKYINKETCTKDGKRVTLAANIGNCEDARRAMEDGAEGVGLFRTEFLFMNGNRMPTEEEQFEQYRKAAVICKGKTLTIRTLDIGGDKDIPYMGLTKESNPFLGYRAIRFCLDRVDVFTVQLRAILRASAFGAIRIMIPLVTSLSEVVRVRQIVSRIKQDLDRNQIAYDSDIRIGVMIETPAASEISDLFAKESDFFSIGTNDLTQYTIAVDRGNENVAYLYSAFHPAVLRSIQRIIRAAKEEHIEVGMCGEAAADPAMIPLLLAYGLDEFSVTASKVLETRKNIAMWTMKEAQTVTEKAMSLCTEKEVSTYLSDYIVTKNELATKAAD